MYIIIQIAQRIVKTNTCVCFNYKCTDLCLSLAQRKRTEREAATQQQDRIARRMRETQVCATVVAATLDYAGLKISTPDYAGLKISRLLFFLMRTEASKESTPQRSSGTKKRAAGVGTRISNW